MVWPERGEHPKATRRVGEYLIESWLNNSFPFDRGLPKLPQLAVDVSIHGHPSLPTGDMQRALLLYAFADRQHQSDHLAYRMGQLWPQHYHMLRFEDWEGDRFRLWGAAEAWLTDLGHRLWATMAGQTCGIIERAARPHVVESLFLTPTAVEIYRRLTAVSVPDQTRLAVGQEKLEFSASARRLAKGKLELFPTTKPVKNWPGLGEKTASAFVFHARDLGLAPYRGLGGVPIPTDVNLYLISIGMGLVRPPKGMTVNAILNHIRRLWLSVQLSAMWTDLEMLALYSAVYWWGKLLCGPVNCDACPFRDMSIGLGKCKCRGRVETGSYSDEDHRGRKFTGLLT